MREGLYNLPKHFYKGHFRKNYLGLTNSRCNELFSGSLQSSLYRDSTVDPNRHTRDDPFHGTSDSLDMAFLSPGLSSQDISFSVADDHMGSDHFPI